MRAIRDAGGWTKERHTLPVKAVDLVHAVHRWLGCRCGRLERMSRECFGLIGGLGVGAAVHYYERLAKAHSAAGVPLDLAMVHADMPRMVRWAESGDARAMAQYTAGLIERLKAAGATFAALPAVTPHLCIGDLFGLGEENIERIKRQNRRKISVIIGNPPYNANQANENDNNKNREYPDIDARIKDTYIKASTAQKTKLYDMYARFFRWASDRIAENGVVAFVSNSSFIDARTFDGFRACLAKEFNEVWVVNLKGNARTSGERRRQEAGNIFDDQIRVGIAVWFCVKKQGPHGFRIFYDEVRDYAKSDEKRHFLTSKPLRERRMTQIRPDAKHNWLNLTDNDFDTLIPVASKAAKLAKKPAQEKAIFKLFSLGVVTARDEWVYGESAADVTEKVNALIDGYNADRKRLAGTATDEIALRLDYSIKWTRAVKRDLSKGVPYAYDDKLLIDSLYRPYVKKALYFSQQLNEMQYLQREVFGIGLDNTAIVVSGAPAAKPFQTLATNILPCYDELEKSQTLPLYRYAKNGERIDNITDWALKQFRERYKISVTPAKAGVHLDLASTTKVKMDSGFRRNDDQKQRGGKAKARAGDARAGDVRNIGKEDIFHYVYAVLHDPVYREKYAQNLKREFPRIPFYADFWQWADWGRELMQLHIGYESIEPWPLARVDVPDEKARKNGAAPKALLRANKDAGSIALDSETTLNGIPREAWDYKLGNRSALEWILDQYKEKTPKDPTIRAKFNTYRFADYKDKVIDLLARVTRVSVATQAIVSAMRAAAR
ncbi:MAG: Eco57I restriction-modification methylase domain-containing protein [Proteobacteria bacterium]|nr:Eco57I restriction-modification methylase domain-containing protein [Pseudomonadota bacterium]